MHAIIQVIEDRSKACDKILLIWEIFFDFVKAFDLVEHVHYMLMKFTEKKYLSSCVKKALQTIRDDSWTSLYDSKTSRHKPTNLNDKFDVDVWCLFPNWLLKHFWPLKGLCRHWKDGILVISDFFGTLLVVGFQLFRVAKICIYEYFRENK